MMTNMVYLCLTPLACLTPRLRPKAKGKRPRAVIWPPYSPDIQAAQLRGKGKGTTTDPKEFYQEVHVQGMED